MSEKALSLKLEASIPSKADMVCDAIDSNLQLFYECCSAVAAGERMDPFDIIVPIFDDHLHKYVVTKFTFTPVASGGIIDVSRFSHPMFMYRANLFNDNFIPDINQIATILTKNEALELFKLAAKLETKVQLEFWRDCIKDKDINLQDAETNVPRGDYRTQMTCIDFAKRCIIRRTSHELMALLKYVVSNPDSDAESFRSFKRARRSEFW